jgi:UDP-N-acetylglucosamine 2-epimerase (non-hydrolysing)
MNSQLTSRIATIHFSPTEMAKRNLLSEGINAENILVTGNTVIDDLFYTVNKLKIINNLPEINDIKTFLNSDSIILVTGHRSENIGDRFINICNALKEIAEQEKVQIIYPVHFNPNVQKPVLEVLGQVENVKLINPLSFAAFTWLMIKSKNLITDSGGIQEEAPSLGKPVLVMHEVTKLSEVVDAGTVILVGTN